MDGIEISATSRSRGVARLLLTAAYAVAGVAHLSIPGPFLDITPDWVPDKPTVIAATGLCELAGAAGLSVPRLRRAAGIGLAAYAVCVFPANLKHAFGTLPPNSVQLGWAYHAPRLALQPVLVWWALWASGVIDWPFRARAGAGAPVRPGAGSRNRTLGRPG